MESSTELKNTLRQKALENWLTNTCHLPAFDLEHLQGDASFRRYFRVSTKDTTFVAMDAPPPQENCHPFVAIAHALRELQLNVPEIFFADLEQGFLLLTDLGDQTYLKVLTNDNVDDLYGQALNALAVLQGCQTVASHVIPHFDARWMEQEWAWHKEWFLEKLLGVTLSDQETTSLDQCMQQLIKELCSQPYVFMHRDYHSANLMLTKQGIAILDFQDAFIGPVTYDLASLLRDCYIAWPETKVKHWALSYYQQLIDLGVLTGVSAETFLLWFDWMSIERHLKALFTFARKAVRDATPSYLEHVPRTLHYLETVSANYAELSPLHDYLIRIAQPAFARRMSCER